MPSKLKLSFSGRRIAAITIMFSVIQAAGCDGKPSDNMQTHEQAIKEGETGSSLTACTCDGRTTSFNDSNEIVVSGWDTPLTGLGCDLPPTSGPGIMRDFHV